MRFRRLLPTLVLTLMALLSARSPAAEEYERPPTLHASEVLADNVAVGDHYKVEDRVTSDGYLYSFVIESDYGRFDALGELTLNIRIEEIGALVQLDNLSKSEVFVSAVGAGALQSLKGFQTIAKDPIGTVKGIPAGASRFFKRTKHQAEAGYEQAKGLVGGDEGEDKSKEGEAGEAAETASRKEQAVDMTTAYAKQYFGVNQAQRRWAQKLEVDPYSSNEVLRKAIADVAKVDAAGRFAVRLAPIPRVPGASYANAVASLVWTQDPWELVEANTKALLAAGASQEMIAGFFDNVAFSPTLQTAFVAAILDLQPVEHLGQALLQAEGAASEDDARIFAQGAVMLRWFHHKQSPIVSLLEGGDRVFIARSADDRIVVMLPVDMLFWTKEMADAFRTGSELLPSGARLEIWVTGGVSELARAGLESLGWKVQTGMTETMKSDPVVTPTGE